MKKDYYEILGIPKDSTLQQIKKAYRSKALKHHPDRVEDGDKKAAEEKFKEITEAYGVLSDPKKREMYDKYGHAGIDQQYTTEDIFRGADFGDLGDIFSQFFGGGDIFDMFGGGGGGRSSRRGPRRGGDIQYELELTLEEAFNGVKRKIQVPRNEICNECNGTGARNGTAFKNCSTCGGSGYVMLSSGFFRMQQPCSACGGAGKVITEYCPKCNGQGFFKVSRSVEVNIPAGVDSNSRLRVRGQGHVAGGGAGDLYLYLRVLPHSVFKREGNDLYMELTLPFYKASLGGEVTIETFDGNVSMKIPATTQSGKVFRLRDKGMPDINRGAKGDLYVKTMIVVPQKLTTEQKKLMEEFARLSGDARVGEESIKEKIKKVFK
jgi:molecular chaperone DnaJ